MLGIRHGLSDLRALVALVEVYLRGADDVLSLRAYDARVAQLESEILEPVSFVVDAATRRRRAARAAEASAI